MASDVESIQSPGEVEKAPEEFEKPASPSDDLNAGQDEARLSNTKSLEKQVSLPREILVVLLISLAQFTTQAGLGSLLALTHIIGDHYNITDPGILAWLIAGYSLTVGTFILVSGRLGDVFGWKRMLVIGYSWYALWTVVLGLAWYSNHVLFIFARVLQGIGPSLCLPNALALLGGIYEAGKRKNMAFAVFGGCAPAGALVGFVFAGLFALAWWPWLFWTGGIILGIIAVVAALAIPDPQPHKPGIKGLDLKDAVAQLDVLGAVVGIIALVLFNFSWNQAPSSSWSSPYIIITLILGVLLIPAFFYIEVKIARNPLLPLEVFTSDNAFVLACVACGWANFGIWVYYLLQILQTLRHTPTLLQAAYLSPLAVSGMLAAIVSGRLLGIMKPAWVMIGALLAFLTGTILVATLPPHQIYWAQIFVTVSVACWGMDMSFPSATIIVSNSMDKEHQGVAASLVTTIVNYSISLGLGFAGTVQKNVQNGDTDVELLRGYRSALYLGIGLAGLGLCIAIIFLVKSYARDRRLGKGEGGTKDVEYPKS